MLRLFAALFGPVFAKEMVEMARRKRYYLNRALYGGVLLFTLFVVWDKYQWQMNRGNPSIHVMARLATDLFHAVSSVQFGAVFLLMPVFLCGVIAGEREERTLELLFTTQMADREIVLGKLLSRVAALVALIACALPVVSLISLFGGIDPDALVRILAATLAAILYAGAHAIYFSTVTRSPMGALVRTYWWMALWLFAVPAVVMLTIQLIYRGRMPGPYAWFAMGSLVFINPIGAFVVAIEGTLYNAFAGRLGAWFYPLVLILPACWSAFLVWRAVRRLRFPPTPMANLWSQLRRLRKARPKPEGVTPARPVRRRRAELTWYSMRVHNPLWLRARRAPVYDREGYIGRIQWAAWLVAAAFIILIALVEPRGLRHRGPGTVFGILSWLGVAALLAILAGSSLVGDRRRGFWELVLITPLSGREVFDGTLLAVWHHVRRLFWLPVALGIFFCFTGSVRPDYYLLSLAPATLFGGLLLVHGVACSLAARTTPMALLATFLFPLVMFVGIFMPVAFFREAAAPVLLLFAVVALPATWLLARRRTHPLVVACHLLAVHLTLVLLATCWFWKLDHRGEDIAVIHPGFWVISFLEGHIDQEFAYRHYKRMPVWMPVFGAYLAALAASLVWARFWVVRHFDRLAGRMGARPGKAPRPRKRLPVQETDSVSVPELRP